MAFNTFFTTASLLLLASSSLTAYASDPDIIADFILPQNLTFPDANFFTSTATRDIFNAPISNAFKVTKVSMAEFPALNGQSVSYAVLTFPVNAVNPPHTHPRSAELLFLVQGCLDVGFVDTANKLYAQRLQATDMFVFPKGLVHYQSNCDSEDPSIALSAFGSSNAGTVSVPASVFTSGIDESVLAKSFNTDVTTVEKIKAGLAPKP
ncbi:putative germin-like protein 9-2 [Acorus gramineus]|uniref:Germin-like protein n=1 Tax=Acorus gramineus TaxID=55184 RepID=A0AAV9A7F0_ACOGR|nr:putative germin-like protein 9-2 [Acorus gramineus]